GMTERAGLGSRDRERRDRDEHGNEQPREDPPQGGRRPTRRERMAALLAPSLSEPGNRASLTRRSVHAEPAQLPAPPALDATGRASPRAMRRVETEYPNSRCRG